MSLHYRASKFLRHITLAGNEHSIHSPFVFDLYTTAIKPNKQFYCFEKIENVRKKAEVNHSIITVKDYGAGSEFYNSNKRKISEIAKWASKNKRQSQLLFNLVWFLKPTTIIDLGTSLGITTSYLASPDSKSTVYTFEGCPGVSAIAKKHFSILKLNNIQQIVGNIDVTLKENTQNLKEVDFAFFDANHKYTPTLNYFKTLLPRTHQGTVFVFDDIYWSKEMNRAWEEIKAHPSVTLSIDLFYFGIVFFRNNAPKQHFRLKF